MEKSETTLTGLFSNHDRSITIIINRQTVSGSHTNRYKTGFLFGTLTADIFSTGPVTLQLNGEYWPHQQSNIYYHRCLFTLTGNHCINTTESPPAVRYAFETITGYAVSEQEYSPVNRLHITRLSVADRVDYNHSVQASDTITLFRQHTEHSIELATHESDRVI